jgi:excisionase family DNA binding protein
MTTETRKPEFSNANGTTSDRAFTVRELAERAGVKPHVILKLIADGKLRAIDYATAGRPRWRIFPEDLAAFEARRVTNASEKPPRRRKKPVGAGLDIVDPETGKIRREFRVVGSIKGVS